LHAPALLHKDLMTTATDITAWISGVDIYLLDQILKNRFPPGTRILDAGCGGGRNLTYFLRAGYDVHGVDHDPAAVSATRALAAQLAPNLDQHNFTLAPIEELPFPDASFDTVLANAVLHFARDESHFLAMLHEMWRVLRPGGIFFARLTSSIGIEQLVRPLGSGLYALPDRSTRYLVDMPTLLDLTRQLQGDLLEPIKTVNVQNLRCMTTWVLRKS
jgi:SAM-dependent methyltransferase